MENIDMYIKIGNIEGKYKKKERGQNILIIKILTTFTFFLLIVLLMIYTNKKLRKKISKITVALKNDEIIKAKYKKLKEILSKINYNNHLISIANNNSTFINQYFIRFQKVFDKYRNETELSDEYKNKFKQFLLNKFSSLFKKIYKKIDIIIFNIRMNFGNAIFTINNLIYFCEILGCKKIYLSKRYWFVKKLIYNKELNYYYQSFKYRHLG
jgi:hypothetical protein